jgi:hypothetical protein
MDANVELYPAKISQKSRFWTDIWFDYSRDSTFRVTNTTRTSIIAHRWRLSGVNYHGAPYSFIILYYIAVYGICHLHDEVLIGSPGNIPSGGNKSAFGFQINSPVMGSFGEIHLLIMTPIMV